MVHDLRVDAQAERQRQRRLAVPWGRRPHDHGDGLPPAVAAPLAGKGLRSRGFPLLTPDDAGREAQQMLGPADAV